MNSKSAAAFAALVLALPGAAIAGAPAGKAAQDPFGEAVRQTMMAQVIDPEPQYTKPMAGDADQAAKAVDRYRNGAVKQPDKIRTASSSAGGN